MSAGRLEARRGLVRGRKDDPASSGENQGHAFLTGHGGEHYQAT